jgi:uncharacterized protein YgfB (UPF0149 family)
VSPTSAGASLEPTGSTPSTFSLAFDFKDPANAADWLRRVHDHANDLIALAREGARRPTRRVLARAEIRRQTREAGRNVLALLAEAEAGLTRRADAAA